MKNKSIKAYAKINLYLDILSKRDDGYHEIRSVMHKISLFDEITVSVKRSDRESTVVIRCNDPSVPLGEKNIAYKAAKKYLDTFCKDSYEVSVDINKRIPMAGGLAGGSTDAAATLRLMSDILCANESSDELYSLAATLGADVPFCLADGACITEGIGERLSPVPSLQNCFLLISNSKETVSTPDAYATLDSEHDDFSSVCFDSDRFNRLLRGLETGDAKAVADSTFNIFESAILKEKPLAASSKQIMLNHGALTAMMSGSGPTVFGIFDEEEKAKQTCAKLLDLGHIAYVCTPI